MGLRKAWLDRGWLDYLLLLLPLLWLVLPEAVRRITPALDTIYQVAAGYLAIAAAVVTFACSSLYQSDSSTLRWGRLRYGPQLRVVWRGSIISTVLSAAAAILAVAVGALAGSVWGLIVVTGAVLVGTVRTLRAVVWLDIVFAAEDNDLPTPDHVLPEQRKPVRPRR